MSLKENAQAAILTERAAIQDEMKWIREERRHLHDRYYDLMDRLRYLDERDMEAVDPNVVINQLIDTTNRLGNIVPEVTIGQVVEHLQKEFDLSAFAPKKEEEEQSIIPKEEIFKEQLREDAQSNFMRGTKNDYEKQAPLVVKIMKELGRPVQLAELKDMMYEKHNVIWKNASNAINTIMIYEPKIEKIQYGTYQYRA
jgi:hypothetical protein